MRGSPISGHLIKRMFLLRVITIFLVSVMTRMTTSTPMLTRARDISRNNHHVQIRFLTTMTVHLSYIHSYRT